jgi:hypothetical protein
MIERWVHIVSNINGAYIAASYPHTPECFFFAKRFPLKIAKYATTRTLWQAKK